MHKVTNKKQYKQPLSYVPPEEITDGIGALCGMILGGIIGLIGGPIGVILGGFIGIMIGDQVEREIIQTRQNRRSSVFLGK